MSIMNNLFGSKKTSENSNHNTIKITSKNFSEEVENSDVPVLIDFWAPWCGPCKMLTPIIEELAEEYDGKAKIGKFNTDDNPQFVSKFGIRGIPTLIFFNNGKEVKRLVGVSKKTQIKSILDGMLE